MGVRIAWYSNRRVSTYPIALLVRDRRPHTQLAAYGLAEKMSHIRHESKFPHDWVNLRVFICGWLRDARHYKVLHQAKGLLH